jgi:hypothetical protein
MDIGQHEDLLAGYPVHHTEPADDEQKSTTDEGMPDGHFVLVLDAKLPLFFE